MKPVNGSLMGCAAIKSKIFCLGSIAYELQQR
jgi:hypothetical protein